MKAVFLTTPPNDVSNIIGGWDCWNSVPSERIVFDYTRPIDDAEIVRRVRAEDPDVIFYMGVCGPIYTPSIDTFKRLKDIAPLIHFCYDAGDPPWHPLLLSYRSHDCFDLQITIDGVQSAPVDLITLTPIDSRPYSTEALVRDIRCGFSGNLAPGSARAKLLFPLRKEIPLRKRDINGPYSDHINFTRRCKMIVNTSYCGSEEGHHVKGRVLEAAFAGCALIEHIDSPISDWFPRDYYFTYRSMEEIRDILRNATDSMIEKKASFFQSHAEDLYTPDKIFKEMLEEVGL